MHTTAQRGMYVYVLLFYPFSARRVFYMQEESLGSVVGVCTVLCVCSWGGGRL